MPLLPELLAGQPCPFGHGIELGPDNFLVANARPEPAVVLAMTFLSVAIVGAGIGGLAAAANLRRVGVDVQVYEQAGTFSRVGAGIQMTPNAMKVLCGMGLEERLRNVAFAPQSALNRDWNTGEVSNELPIASVMEARYGAPYLLMHRADLHEAIASTVPAELVHRNRKVVGMDQDGHGVTLTFADGSRAQADAVIGADGVHSLIRELLLGPENPEFTGRVAYRTTFPSALLNGAQIAGIQNQVVGAGPPHRHLLRHPQPG